MLITDLVEGIEAWAADEDGVHDRCWDAYVWAKRMLGQPVPAGMDGARFDDDGGS